MALKDLFKSKSARHRADPRIRWFGKLPTYPDYYSSNPDEAWVVEFNDWVLKGFEVYRGRQAGTGRSVAKLPISGCAIRLPKSEMTVFVSILDFGGDMRGRPFPMCFYAAVPTVQWPGPTSERLAGASRAIRDLLALRRAIPRFLNSPGRFESMFGSREVDLHDVDGETTSASWVAAGKQIALGDWFEAAKDGIKVKDAATWFQLAQEWGDSLASHESKTFEPTLRFPLAMRLPLDAQLAGWVRWLETRMDLKRRLLSLFVSGEPGEGVGHLTAVARQPLDDDFLLLTPLAQTLSYLDDVAALEPRPGVEDGQADGSADPSARTLTPDGSWVDFVSSAVSVT